MLHGLINELSAALADAVCAGLVALNADAGSLIALRANQHDIRNVDGGLELDATGIDLAPGLGLHLALMLGVDIDALHHDAAPFGHHVDDRAALALVFQPAANDFHSITLVDLYSH